MGLAIIGSGFGRTGTRSLKEALETLGFGPCHHMEEVFQNPGQIPYWQAVAAGEAVDWDEVFAGYGSQIDWPGAHVWRELALAFPDAKVVHSVRPEASWLNSFSKTIGKLMTIAPTMSPPPHLDAMLGAATEMIGNRTFGGRWADPEVALAAYHKREADVRAAIPPERLLVFDVAQGWAPLCAFLDVPVPETAFPNRNNQEDFWAALGGPPA